MNRRRRALHSSESNDAPRNSWSSFSRTPLVATATVFGVLMLAFHVKADTSNLQGSGEPLFFDRVKEGPLGLTNADLIFFGAIFLLAFELLQFLVEGSGSKCNWAHGEVSKTMHRFLFHWTFLTLFIISFLQDGSAPI